MSADNYYFVRRCPDGKYGVSHRFASVYYADEKYTPDGPSSVDKKDISLHDTLEEALLAAHKYVSEDYIVEYGVVLQEGLA